MASYQRNASNKWAIYTCAYKIIYTPDVWFFLKAIPLRLTTDELSAVRCTAGTLSCRGDTGVNRPPTPGTVFERNTGTCDAGGIGFCFELCGRTLSLNDISLRTASGDSAPGGRNREMVIRNTTTDVDLECGPSEVTRSEWCFIIIKCIPFVTRINYNNFHLQYLKYSRNRAHNQWTRIMKDVRAKSHHQMFWYLGRR